MLNTEESRAGGKACVEALCGFDMQLNARNPDEYFRGREAAIADFVSHAGDLNPHAAGFVKALVEYAFLCIEAGTPDLDCWKPESSCSDAELRAVRQQFADTWHSACPLT